MAKKVILGTDIARDAFKVKVNENFTELYDKDVAIEEQINTLAPHLDKLVTDAGGVHGFKTEAGIWTPIIEAGTTQGTVVYTQQDGTYVKNGKLITITFALVFTMAGGVGNLSVGGLPINANKYYETGTISIASAGATGLGIASLADTSVLSQFRLYTNQGVRADASLISDKGKIALVGTVTYQIS